MGLSPLVLQPQVGLLYQLQMIVTCGALVPGLNYFPVVLCQTNSMWMTMRLNLGLLSEKPATNHLSYCMAVKIPRGLKF